MSLLKKELEALRERVRKLEDINDKDFVHVPYGGDIPNHARMKLPEAVECVIRYLELTYKPTFARVDLVKGEKK